jgi:flavin prenyltransferase
MQKPRVVVGISGATGFQYGVKALQLLRELGAESHLVMSKAAGLTREHETTYSRDDVIAMADVFYPTGAVGAAISSGSFRTAGMIVAPCSMHTLAAIANGVTDNLLTRAADVVLKERRKLVLMVRETPLHLGHIRNMAAVTEYGAIVFPPVPALYAGPQSIEQIVTHSTARALGLLGFESNALPRWGESLPALAAEGEAP